MTKPCFSALKLVWLAVTAAIPGGCGNQAEIERTPVSHQSADQADHGKPEKDENSGCYAIINGAETTRFPEVGLIAITDPQDIIAGFCTGTFVSHNTMITAAHCIKSGRETDLIYTPGTRVDTGRTVEDAEALVRSGIRARRVFHNTPEVLSGAHTPATESDVFVKHGHEDVAIVTFPDNTSRSWSKVMTSPPSHLDEAEIVGYGLNTRDHNAPAPQVMTKRHGRNKIIYDEGARKEFLDAIVLLGRSANVDTSGDADDSVTSFGDSGGPIFIDGHLAGITSNGSESEELRKIAMDLYKINGDALSVFAPLQISHATNLMKQAESAGALISRDTDSGQTESSAPESDGNDSEDDEDEEDDDAPC